MPAWLAAIPVIGNLIDAIGNAVDKTVTSDAERLAMKARLMELYLPVIVAVIDAQKAMGELQAKLAEIEGRSEHWLVWSRRPIVALLAVGNFLLAPFTGHMPVEDAFYFACLANGLDIASRGVEKVVSNLKEKERI